MTNILCFIFQGGTHLSWTQTLPKGTVSHTSQHCTTMTAFQNSLVGRGATAITIIAGSTSYSCTDATIAKSITDAFATCTTNTCSRQVFSCQGKNFRVGPCGAGGEISVSNGICSCSGSLTIRPCINNDNWGGAGPSTCSQSSQTLSIIVKVGGI